MVDLKPCPFCGGEAKLSHYETFDNDEWAVACVGECEVEPATNSFFTKEQAVAAWNSRAERTCHETMIDKFFHGCDSCGYMWQFFYSIGKRERPNYCPNCGAKVIGG